MRVLARACVLARVCERERESVMGRERIVMTLRVASPCDMQEKTEGNGQSIRIICSSIYLYFIATSFGFHQKPSGIYKTPTEIRKTKNKKLRCM